MIKSDSNILRDILSWITIIANGGIRDSANVGDVTVKIMRMITIKTTAMTNLSFFFVISEFVSLLLTPSLVSSRSNGIARAHFTLVHKSLHISVRYEG